MSFDWTIVTAILCGVAIAAAAGLRAFLPLLVVGLAGRFGVIHIEGQSALLASDAALWALAVATVLEILGDKVPVVDHALDAISTVIRPVAGALGGYAVLSGSWSAPLAVVAAVVLGTGTLGIHALKSKTRIGSSALTMGTANPLLSFAEDAVAIVLSAAAVLLPMLALILLVAFVWTLRRMRRRPATHSA